MPLKDLLWACPLCHAIEAIDGNGTCRNCHGAFRRGRGARIVGQGTERSAVDWLARLPWPDVDGEGTALPPGLQPPFETTVILRVAAAERPLYRAGRFLGAIEVYGAKQQGRLLLTAEELSFSGGYRAQLAELTGIQPSSSAIQVKARAQPVVSIRFPDGSVRLWEQRLKYCTRAAYRAAGRGEIEEFQPWIRVR